MKIDTGQTDRRPADSRLLVRFGWLKICACALMIVLFGRQVSGGNSRTVRGETIIYEIDPTSLLSIDSTQDTEEPALLDIQMPPYAILQDFNAPKAIDNSATNFVAAVKEELSQIRPIPAGHLQRQLLKDTIAPPNQPPVDNKTDELRQLIERIRSVQVEPQQPVRHPTDAAPTASPELNTITPQANPAAQPASESIPAEPLPAATSSSEQTFQTVKNLLKDSNQIAAPLELAEALYRSGKPALAGLCYKKALTLTDANDPNKASERAWILFQTGNCLKYDDPNTAKESYAQLLRTYPNSPWVEVAKTRHDLIDLFQQDETSKLIHPPKP